nr:phosphatase PAP2 family protein [Nocardia bovistercoris]
MAAALVILGVQVSASGWLTGADVATYDWFLTHRDPTLTVAAKGLTTVGGPLGVSAVTALAALVLGWRRRGFVAASAVLGIVTVAFTASSLTKLAVARERPPQVARLVPEDNYSFPSGHVTAITALAGALLLVYALGRPTRARIAVAVTLAVTVVTTVGATRLYLGVHWLTDVVGGVILGVTVVCAAMVPLCWSTSTRARLTGTPPPTPISVANHGSDAEAVSTRPIPAASAYARRTRPGPSRRAATRRQLPVYICHPVGIRSSRAG